MNPREAHIEFIRLNLVTIAACAWEGYQSSGRGLVVVDSDQPSVAAGAIALKFVPEGVLSDLFGNCDGQEARMVADYDPELEVVLCFLCAPNKGQLDLDSYRFRSVPPPKQAAESISKSGVADDKPELAVSKVICAWCGLILRTFGPKLGIAEEKISHGICPDCADRMFPSDGRSGESGPS